MSKQLIDGAMRETGFLVDPALLTIIGIDTKHTSRGDDAKQGQHPLYDPRIELPIDEALVRSIMRDGVLQAIDVIVEGKGDDKIYVVRSGKQRTRAIREANKRLKAAGEKMRLMPVRAERAADTMNDFRKMLTENALRQNDDLLTQMHNAAICKQMGDSVADIAITFGKSTSTIKEWIEVDGLAADAVKQAVREGRLSATAAYKFVPLPKEKQVEELEKLLAASNGGTVTVTAAGTHVANARKPKNGKPAVERSNAPTKRLIARIVAFVDEGKNEETIYGTPKEQEAFMDALRFFRGDLSPKSIRGLSAVIHAVSAKKSAKNAE